MANISPLSSTATCAMAVLSVPMPSGVLALMPTRDGSTPSNLGDVLLDRLGMRPDLGSGED